MQTARGKLSELQDRYRSVPVQDKGSVFNTNLIFALELGFMLDSAETIAVSALERKESRGAHFLLEKPERGRRQLDQAHSGAVHAGRPKAGVHSGYRDPVAAAGQVVLAARMERNALPPAAGDSPQS